ncbi:hypothetical protein [Nonomuraea sp. NPDC049695]|uniref:hypothetical protein n=1 Tax=Nonomuraea sp. NPDC049695 TaxID=3154734 RepID=UPI00341FE78F
MAARQRHLIGTAPSGITLHRYSLRNAALAEPVKARGQQVPCRHHTSGGPTQGIRRTAGLLAGMRASAYQAAI